MVELSYIIGRFSKKIGSNFQYFPIDNWEKDLKIANKLKILNVEWIISDFSNPIFSETFLSIIKKELKKNKIKISCIGLDVFLKEPIFRIDKQNFDWIVEKVGFVISKFKIKNVTIPLEETSRISNYLDFNKSIKRIKELSKVLGKKTKICIETDMSPGNLNKFFNYLKSDNIGLLLDTGNLRANGYDFEKYINKFKEKIFRIHIKKRDYMFHPSMPINSSFKELNYIAKNLNKLKNIQDICLQNFRSEKNYKKETKKTLTILRKILDEQRK